MSPIVGPLAGGNLVKIIGTNLDSPDLTLHDVTFDLADGQSLTGIAPVVVSDGEVDVTVPDASADAKAIGSVFDAGDVTVHYDVKASTETLDSAAAADGDAGYIFGAPVLDSVNPVEGPLIGGNLVKIIGSGFQNPALTFTSVTFEPVGDTNGSQVLDGVNPVVVSDTEVDVTAPDGTEAAGGQASVDASVSVNYDVTRSHGTQTDNSFSANPGAHAYRFGAPVTVDSVQPAAGPLAGGNLVKIIGSGFQDPALTFNSVSFDTADGIPLDGVSPVVVSDTEVDVTAPDATAEVAAGDATVATSVTLHYDVNNSTNGATADSAPAAEGDDGYLFGAPVITSVAPADGPLIGGNLVKITGSGFQNPALTFTAVSFDPTGTPPAIDGVNPVVVSDTEIDVTAPDATGSAAGEASVDAIVTVTYDVTGSPSHAVDDSVPAVAGADAYQFGAPVTVDSVAPAAGPLAGGNRVKIIGTNLEDAALTLDTVTFDGAGGATVDGLNPVVISDTEVDVTAPDATAEAGSETSLETTVTLHYGVDGSTDGATVESSPAGTGTNAYLFRRTRHRLARAGGRTCRRGEPRQGLGLWIQERRPDAVGGPLRPDVGPGRDGGDRRASPGGRVGHRDRRDCPRCHGRDRSCLRRPGRVRRAPLRCQWLSRQRGQCSPRHRRRVTSPTSSARPSSTRSRRPPGPSPAATSSRSRARGSRTRP